MKYKRGMWVNHLLAKRRCTSETIDGFVERSVKLNCITVVRH